MYDRTLFLLQHFKKPFLFYPGQSRIISVINRQREEKKNREKSLADCKERKTNKISSEIAHKHTHTNLFSHSSWNHELEDLETTSPHTQNRLLKGKNSYNKDEELFLLQWPLLYTLHIKTIALESLAKTFQLFPSAKRGN